MLGTDWRPSAIEDKIYGIMENYEAGTELYEEVLTDVLADYLTKEYPSMQWNLGCSEWPNTNGGICAVSWMEEGHLHMIMFDYIKKGRDMFE